MKIALKKHELSHVFQSICKKYLPVKAYNLDRQAIQTVLLVEVERVE